MTLYKILLSFFILGSLLGPGRIQATDKVVDQLLFRVNYNGIVRLFFFSDLQESKQAIIKIAQHWKNLIGYDLFLIDDIFFSHLQQSNLQRAKIYLDSYLTLTKILVLYEQLKADRDISVKLEQQVRKEAKKLGNVKGVVPVLSVLLFLQQRYGERKTALGRSVLSEQRERLRLAKEFLKFNFSNVKITPFVTNAAKN